MYLNDEFVPEEMAVLQFRDLSFQRGYGIFDFFRLVQNHPLFLDDHLQRFASSAAQMHLPLPLEIATLKESIFRLIDRNNLPDTGIRLGLTGGYSPDGFLPGTPNLVISQHRFTLPTDAQRRKGIRLLSYPYQRQLPQVKSIDYLMAVWLQPAKAQKGVDDFLYHTNGVITECPRSNFFLVTADNRIVTPEANVLQGITRKKVLSLAKEHYMVEAREVRLDEIASATEAFVTSTTKQILPVAQIDETRFTEQKTSNALLQLFRSACEQDRL